MRRLLSRLRPLLARVGRLRPGAVIRRTGRFSLRSRLLALTLALVATGLVVSDLVVLGSVRMQLVGRLDQQLERYCTQLAHRSGKPGGPGAASTPGTSTSTSSDGGWDWTPDGQVQYQKGLPSQFEIRFLAADGSVLRTVRQPIAESDPGPRLPAAGDSSLLNHLGKGFNLPAEHGSDTWRVLILPVVRTSPPTGANPSSYVMVAVSSDEVEATVEKLRAAFLAIGTAVLLLIAALGTFAVRAGLTPLRRIERGTELIAAGELSYRMPELPTSTEVGRLSAALNGMLDQIESAFAARAESEERMRSFVADASHELRTPLAGIRGFAELYRMGALPSESDVKRTMNRIESEAVRMGGLVEDLLMLARLDEERPLDLAPMDLRTLAADALHDLTALDPTRAVALTGPGGDGTPGAATVLGDEARLRQVVTNLVGNAVKHTPPGTAVRIGVGTDKTGCILEVADSGPGLTKDQAARVFERFYRVDGSRSRHDGGGAGLGLAIAAALTRAHGGTLSLDTAPATGATFRLHLPRSSGA
ncbi:two-component system OmpR family sensor kinase [Kitasatospora sp. MAP12-15]|uniref:sensor histidine kinase n=1 Tax=unclassified Kitasatospora TaxID=2633591 RepID=UPI002476C486|nr:HAMP domain-containing sensor histidine kinase [Kitasatospora sp. MAP12-44]MDH6112036.1 two-component system OmpR family sensor kinase [Kitasatospora sp. MAP12-44]